ncbi:Zinc finger protein AZF2 [Olea europaea subsp. europaea]|uniref:Zinc finger protein AZF2 n=1 Tax=Olea europaea subsp. europaea TaxID=158383 RepID=A0A8S0R6R1_OLEEU|nr:Zinc finger protein AZF2 [Olea europaea subsp. europaea]
MPKEGDLIAYRILELSSSWTPELSVGKVSWVNTESRQIMLMPVPEYPVVSKKSDEDEYVSQPGNSLYKEDGSLEIDLSSLVDVRIVKGGNTGLRSASPSSDNEEHGKLHLGKQIQPPIIENKVNAWDEISETLNAKKAQLSQGSGKKSWSHKALRGSVLGPTMAILSSKKQN